ncbi:hypothetical protein D3C71_2149570 [compost metagenome]
MSSQLTGLEQCNQVKQLRQIVLYRCRCQEQTIFFTQLHNELVVGCLFIFQLMGLVYNEQVIIGI